MKTKILCLLVTILLVMPLFSCDIAEGTFNRILGAKQIVKFDGFNLELRRGVYEVVAGEKAPVTSIRIPSECNGIPVTSIGEYAFSETELESIEIPASITSISCTAFRNCTKLENITVDANNTAYHSIDNCIIETESKTLIVGCKNSIIPTNGSVTSIGAYSFYACTELESITISDSVISIGEYAFYACTGLKSVTFDENSKLESIGRSAFYYCTGLKSVTFGKLKRIGSAAFGYCTGLTSITIPNSVISIGDSAFSDCDKLVEIYNKSAINVTEYALNVYTPNTGESKLHTVDDYVFYEDGETIYLVDYIGANSNVSLPENYDGKNYDIYNFAFFERSDITSITIPDSVTSIDVDAFAYCKGLTSVTFGENSKLERIYSSAFENCTELTSITIPSSVTDIDTAAFLGCSGLESIIVASGNTVYHSENNCLIRTKSETLILGCKNSIIPADESVTIINDLAFYNCTGLVSINYNGTKAEWAAIEKGNDWNSYTGEYVVKCTDGELTKAES